MVLTTDKARWSEDSEGFWVSFRTTDRGPAVQIASDVKDKPFTVEVKPRRQKRSLDANAYCWVLLDKLSSVLRVPKVDIYRRLIKDVGGNCDVVEVPTPATERLIDGWGHNGIGWVADVEPTATHGRSLVFLYYGSSTYDTAQMGRLIDLIINECKEQGIDTATPDEVDNMLSLWGSVR